MLLAGCGSAACLDAGCGAAPPSIAPSTDSIGDADEGKTLTFHVGDVVSVALHQQQGFQPWSNLDSTNHAVLVPKVDTRRAAAKGVTLGLFDAVSAGTAQITAYTGMDCSPGAACPALARVWTVTVQVV